MGLQLSCEQKSNNKYLANKGYSYLVGELSGNIRTYAVSLTIWVDQQGSRDE